MSGPKDKDDGAENRDELPDYSGTLRAFHVGFENDLRAVVQSLPMHARMRVADVGCGDGFYSRLLAERLGEDGGITGFDANRACLAQAEQAAASLRGNFTWTEATLEQLPREHFDLVFCAQSLFSFPEPVAALKKFRDGAKFGGLVAVLENDTLHQCLLPWPSDVELKIRLAEYEALKAESNQPQKFYVGRRFPQLFDEAGIEPLYFRTLATDCRAPLNKSVQKFIDGYLDALFDRIEPYTTAGFRAETIEKLNALRRSPHFTFTWTNLLIWGRKN